MPEWDYATLSKLAKEFGGPEQLIATITKNASKAGMGKGIIIGASIATAGVITYEKGAQKIKDFIAKRKQEKADAELARKELLKKLHEQDNLDPTELNGEDN